jgi:Na+/proline symporter
MLDNQLLDFVVMALYFAVMIGAGYWGLRRDRSADDYLLTRRYRERPTDAGVERDNS